MKTKNEIYVVVDTPKKAKKFPKVLDMFGEHIERFTRESIEEYNAPWLKEKTPSVFYDSENKWIGEHAESLEGKTQASIKELRNILAVEHLKEGDYVVFGIGSTEYVVKYKMFCGNYFESIDYYMIGCSGKTHGCWAFDNFIRYATEEERIFLEPKEEKKELEVGKWYKYPEYPKFLSIHTNNGNRYGFDINGLWFNSDDSLLGCSGYVEATDEEVKQALIKEADKRYKVGDSVKSFDLGEFTLDGLNLMYSQQRNVLYATYGVNHILFNNGKWAEVLPEPSTQGKITDQDIATLERLHDTLADVHGYSLEFELMKSARVLADKLRELNTKTK